MGSKDHSFDIVSEVDLQEVDNAVTQAMKEIGQRFDFKGSISSIELDKTNKTITLKAENDYKLNAVAEMLKMRSVKRGISLKALKFEEMQTGFVGGSVQQVVKLQSGIPGDKAKEINRAIKELKLKVQGTTQGEQVRVQAPKIDDLQAAIGALKKMDFGIDLQCSNFR
jgi:uncharacterized protein YajQ (UPF0234 family)